jgi:hypothetical protein
MATQADWTNSTKKNTPILKMATIEKKKALENRKYKTGCCELCSTSPVGTELNSPPCDVKHAWLDCPITRNLREEALNPIIIDKITQQIAKLSKKPLSQTKRILPYWSKQPIPDNEEHEQLRLAYAAGGIPKQFNEILSNEYKLTKTHIQEIGRLLSSHLLESTRLCSERHYSLHKEAQANRFAAEDKLDMDNKRRQKEHEEQEALRTEGEEQQSDMDPGRGHKRNRREEDEEDLQQPSTRAKAPNLVVDSLPT